MSDTLRRTGRTTLQIQKSPHGSIYVWPVSASLRYPQDIARELGRADLEIIPLSRLTLDWLKRRTIGSRSPMPAVVLDHAINDLRMKVQQEALDYLTFLEGIERERAK